MTAMFDTLKLARALRDGGQFTPEQSERLSDALSDAIAGEVVSRADLAATEAKLGRKMDDLDRTIDDLEIKLDHGLREVRAELKAEIKGVEAKIEAAKADTIRWIVGTVGFQSVAIIGAAIVLARVLAR